jgi:hypothetical protein
LLNIVCEGAAALLAAVDSSDDVEDELDESLSPSFSSGRGRLRPVNRPEGGILTILSRLGGVDMAV